MGGHEPRYVSPLSLVIGGERVLYLVVDTSDGDTVVDSFRNAHLADRCAQQCASYRVREYSLR